MVELSIPLIDDFHVHLRQGSLMETVTPLIVQGGCKLVYVMPNLIPPIKTTDEAVAYKSKLQTLAPDVEFLMTLYLGPHLTVDEIYKAHAAGIKGIKSYPKGVTTNSDTGIESYVPYYPIFSVMQSIGMVLNLHGEIPNDSKTDTCVMNAEERFLNVLKDLHEQFPKLKIVLEHATTKVAVDMVKSLGDTVGCTITLHHLQLIVDDWAGQPHHFCKPVAKYPHDRDALREVIRQGHPRFFMGTDSAPHPRYAKEGKKAAAGVFMTPIVAEVLVTLMDEIGALDRIEDFGCRFGRLFYGLPVHDMNSGKRLTLVKTVDANGVNGGAVVPDEIPFVDDEGVQQSVVPFWAGKTLPWQIKRS